MTWSKAWSTIPSIRNPPWSRVHQREPRVSVEVNIHEAKTHLSRLLQRVMLGEDIVTPLSDEVLAPFEGNGDDAAADHPPVGSPEARHAAVSRLPDPAQVCP